MAEPGGLPSMGSCRVGHDWSDLHRDSSTGFFWTLSGVDTHSRGERSVPQRNGAVSLPLPATDASAPTETAIQAFLFFFLFIFLFYF